MVKKTVGKILKSRSFLNLLLKEERNSASSIYYVRVKPNEISHISLIPESSSCLSGPDAKVGSFTGCFDLIKKPFNKYFMYDTVKQLLNGDDWESTIYFKKLLKRKSKKEALKQLEKLTRLIEILSVDGYLSQYQLGRVDETQTISKWKVPLHEIIIGMDRNGQLIRLKNGKHRLAVAQNIGLKEMPAVLTLYYRNAEYMLPDKRRIIRGNPKDFRPL